MTKIEEERWLISCFSQLKNYRDHNKDEIDYVLSILKYRLSELELAQYEKYISNEKEKVMVE